MSYFKQIHSSRSLSSITPTRKYWRGAPLEQTDFNVIFMYQTLIQKFQTDWVDSSIQYNLVMYSPCSTYYPILYQYGYNHFYFRMLITTIHAHMISYYCYHHYYFTVCELQVIKIYIGWLISSTIILNSKVNAVVWFVWIKISFHLTDSVFLMHSHSYFKTHLQCFHFQFYHIPTTIFTLKSHSSLLKNHHCKNSKSSCYVDRDIFFPFYLFWLLQYMIIWLVIIVIGIIILLFVQCRS